MTYEEYLNLFNELKNPTYNNELLNKLKTMPINPNLQELLSPKYEDLINYKFTESVKKIKTDLPTIFDDNNYLDLYLVNFKKEINYLLEMLKIDLLPPSTKEQLAKTIKEGTDKIYEILINEANREDLTGIYALTIKNNQIKWSDNK